MESLDDSTTAPPPPPPPSPPSSEPAHQEDHYVASITEEHEVTCWGCGLILILSPYTPIFKCGWCGAITNHNALKSDVKYFWWKRLRDRCFVCVLVLFMLFIIGGGIWAIYPIVFGVSYFCGIFNMTMSIFFSLTTISTYILSAFRSPGEAPLIPWGSYPTVGKGALEGYTFCNYCQKPKSSNSHHCRSCGICVLDMDHHCPFVSIQLHQLSFNRGGLIGTGGEARIFGMWLPNSLQDTMICSEPYEVLSIGNCVGAANHRVFILFLISAVISNFYVSLISSFTAFHVWPPLLHFPISVLSSPIDYTLVYGFLKQIAFSFFTSVESLPIRGFVVIYLFIASISVEVGLCVLLWQQMSYIYQGKTYLSSLSSRGNRNSQKDWQNIVRFFGCPYSATRYLLGFWNSRKTHKK